MLNCTINWIKVSNISDVIVRILRKPLTWRLSMQNKVVYNWSIILVHELTYEQLNKQESGSNMALLTTKTQSMMNKNTRKKGKIELQEMATSKQ